MKTNGYRGFIGEFDVFNSLPPGDEWTGTPVASARRGDPIMKALTLGLFGLLFISGAVYAQQGCQCANSSGPPQFPTAPIPDVVNFQSTSDTAGMTLDGWAVVPRNANKTWSIQNPDTQTLRLELHSGDQWIGDIQANRASERTMVDAGSGGLFPPDTTTTVAFNWTVPAGSANTADVLYFQWHNDDITNGFGSTSPPFEIDLCNTNNGCGGGGDYMHVFIGWLAAQDALAGGAHFLFHTTSANGTQLSYGWLYNDAKLIMRGHTYQMIVQSKFDVTNGFLKIWRDGVQIVNYTGPMGFGQGTYWGSQIYRPLTTNDTQVSIINNFTLSTH